MTDGARPGSPARRRAPLALLLTPIVALSLLGWAADIAGPALITEHPLLQMALNPRNRYLVLAAAQVDALPYFLVGFTRLVLTDPLGYLLGRQYGDGALRWLERKTGEDVPVRTIVRWFSRASSVIVVVAPNLYVCLLAGATGMRPRRFLVLNVGGTLGRLVLLRLFADAVDGVLDDVLAFIQRYQWWLVALSFLVVALQVRRRAAEGTLETPGAIEEEIREAEHEALGDDRRDER